MNGTKNTTPKNLETSLPIFFGIMVFICLWQFAAGFYSTFILPSPVEVLKRYLVLIRDHQSLANHFFITTFETLSGFFCGLLVALPLSYFMYRRPFIDKLLTPFIVGIQAVPIVALAPLLVIWFGFGMTSKVLVSALVAFFPIVTSSVVGLKETDPKLRELLQIMGASSKEIFFKLEVPSSLPILFGGLKVGLTLSVIGAVVGEFSGSGKGLGYLVNFARGSFDTPLIFIALIALALLGLGLYWILSLFEDILMPWKKKSIE